MDSIHHRLEIAASSVRAVLEHPDFDWPGFPREYCQGSSKLLAKYLVEVCGITPVEGVANGIRYLPCPERDWPIEQSHFWLEHAGYIIDITADQFDDCDQALIVSTDRRWHNQFGGQTRLTQKTCLDLNQYLMERYRRLLRLMSGEPEHVWNTSGGEGSIIDRLTRKRNQG